MTKLKLAVVGAGHLGRLHAKLLVQMPDVALVGIVDSLTTARDNVAADCGTKAYADHRQIVDDVEAAVIATPTRYHHAVALDFLRRGIPLLIEKPLAANVAEAEELVETARRHAALLQVGHIERFNPAFVAAAAHVRDPRYVEAVRAGGFTGRSTDIGVVHDLMIHDIDLLLSLVASPLGGVAAQGLAILGRHEDVAQARLEFENGCVANLSASRVSFSSTPRRQMQIWCAGGFAAIDFAAPSAQVVHPCAEVLRGEFDYESLSVDDKVAFKQRLPREILPLQTLDVAATNALADELRDFVDSIRAGHAPRVTGQQGLAALAVAEEILSAIHARSSQAAPVPPSRPQPAILRGPHWHLADQPRPARREAG